MAVLVRILLASCAIAGLLAVPAALASTAGAPPRARPSAHSLASSRELWATIDVCNPRDQPNTLGIRGSMPGDGQPRDRMYMSFRLQYLDRASKQWTNLATSVASTAFLPVGGGGTVRQDGTSFVIVPPTTKPAFKLRGVVQFQWRRGRAVVASAMRLTTAAHQSVDGADPVGYSVATCAIG